MSIAVNIYGIFALLVHSQTHENSLFDTDPEGEGKCQCRIRVSGRETYSCDKNAINMAPQEEVHVAAAIRSKSLISFLKEEQQDKKFHLSP